MEERETQARPATRAEIVLVVAAVSGPGSLGAILVGVSLVVHVHWLGVVGAGLIATVVVRRWVTFPLLLRWAARRSRASEVPDVRWSAVVMGIALLVGLVVGLTDSFPGAGGLSLAVLGICLALTVASWLREMTPRQGRDEQLNEQVD